MLNLSKYDLSTRSWLDLTVPLRNTLLEALFPDVRFALVHADPSQYDQMVAALSQPIYGPGPEQCPERRPEHVEGLAEGLRLDFASGGRKHGDFFLSDADPLVSSHFWDTAEKAIAYGGTLVTDCHSVHVVQDLKVLVVEDGEPGISPAERHATGDCHAKAGPQLWALLDSDEQPVVSDVEQRALQFRLAVLTGDGSSAVRSSNRGYLGKGTAVVQRPGGPDLDYDLIIPLSAFKSFQPPLGAHVWRAVIGVVSWSEYRPTRISYTVLQWFSKEAIDADVWPHVAARLERLIAAGESTQAAADYFRVGGDDATDYDPDEPLLLNILRADVHSRLTHHPYVVDRLARLLRRRWLHLALGGGLRWAGLQGLPCDDLADDVICAPQLPAGLVIGTRYPVRSWADLRLWHNVHHVVSPSNGRPELTRHKGVVWMSHDTALQVGGDFDGDYFIFTPAADYPHLVAEIQSWQDRPAAQVVKVKERLASPLGGEHLARTAMDNTDNMVGLITYFIAQANAMGRLDLVNALAPELQIAVDKFKYNLSHDLQKIETIAAQLDRLAWLADQKDPYAFLKRPLRVDAQATDTISHLARRVIAHWQPPKLAKRPLVEFAPLFPETTTHRDSALKLSVRYAKLIGEALRQGGKDAFKPIFRALGDWAATRPDPDAWAAAVWHAVHRKGKRGSGSLAFNAFPSQVMEHLAQQPELPDHISIVGLRYNDHALGLDRFNGIDGIDITPFIVTVQSEPFNDKLRSVAYVEGKRLGYVSCETPIPPGVYRLSLLRKGLVIYATYSPTDNDEGAS